MATRQSSHNLLVWLLNNSFYDRIVIYNCIRITPPACQVDHQDLVLTTEQSVLNYRPVGVVGWMITALFWVFALPTAMNWFLILLFSFFDCKEKN